jgi:Calcium-dependent channel, 7TM region, putative phosphate
MGAIQYPTCDCDHSISNSTFSETLPFSTWLFLVTFCCLYTIPLSLTSNLLSANQLATWFPEMKEYSLISGILTGLLYTAFFSVCPFIFRALANFGSSATNKGQAEYRAIRYYWIFILATAFTGSSLATMIRSGLYSGTLLAIARSLPD